MKFDFDTFEFAGLIAPGSVLVLALLFWKPELPHSADAASLIAVCLIAAYVLGHLVAALANLAEPLFGSFGIRDLDALSDDDWLKRGYICSDQLEHFEDLIKTRLERQFPLDQVGSAQRKTVINQMHLAILGNDGAERLATFDGLYSLSRGLCVAFFVCALLAAGVQQYGVLALCLAAMYLSFLRTRKFKRLYSRELVQHFLMPGKCS